MSGHKLVFINGKYVATMALPEWRKPLYQMSAKIILPPRKPYDPKPR